MTGTHPIPAPVDAPRPVPAVVRQAVDSCRVLALDYEDRSGRRSRRVVEPVTLLEVDGREYLAAWCRLRQELRCFRLDRIQRALVTGEIAPPPPWDEMPPEFAARRPPRDDHAGAVRT
jgi:predicted DNA-binding transcriptional regulator YafY